MQGEKIGEEAGKVMSQRVLPNSGGGPKMETTFQARGRLWGVDSSNTGTYVSTLRTNGTLYGEGQGVLMGANGEMATWTGQGVGTLKPDGAVSFRGSLYYESSSSDWSRLNAIVGIFEYEADAQGNTRADVWEWK
jgi:hypothetical protein